MLRIEVRFLLPRVYAGGGAGGEGPPWPPEPARLFAAMVHAWGTSGRDPEEEKALRALEALPPPGIYAPEAGTGVRFQGYVPPNELQGEGGEARLLQKRAWAVREIRGDPVVHFLWEEAFPEGLLAPLNDLLGKVSRIGSSRNPVVARILQEGPEPNWLPSPGGPQGEGVLLRIFYRGFLDDLEENFNRGVRDLPKRYVFYSYAPPLPEPYQPALTFPEGFQITLSPSFPLEVWPVLAERLRSALLGAAGDGAPLVLHGHARAPHVALAPLAFVGRPWADGHLLGAAFFLPREAEAADRIALMVALHRLQKVLPLGPWLLRLGLPGAQRQSLAPGRWTRPARRWASITPVVWDRYPRRRETEEEVVQKMAEHAGLPQPSSFQAGPFSPLRGVPGTRAFRMTPRWQGALITHMVLEFPEPIPGPVLLGRGRFFGMGFFAPLEEEG